MAAVEDTEKAKNRKENENGIKRGFSKKDICVCNACVCVSVMSLQVMSSLLLALRWFLVYWSLYKNKTRDHRNTWL